MQWGKFHRTSYPCAIDSHPSWFIGTCNRQTDNVFFYFMLFILFYCILFYCLFFSYKVGPRIYREVVALNRVSATCDVTESIGNRRRGRKRKSNNSDEIMTSAFNILKATSERIQSYLWLRELWTKMTNFGAFIANKLRAYTQHTRSYVQDQMSNILFSADRGWIWILKLWIHDFSSLRFYKPTKSTNDHSIPEYVQKQRKPKALGGNKGHSGIFTPRIHL